LSVFIIFEAPGGFGLGIRRSALGVERRLTTGGRSNRDLDARVFEVVVGGCEFFQPETGFFAGVAECVVRREYEEYFHESAPLCVLVNSATFVQGCSRDALLYLEFLSEAADTHGCAVLGVDGQSK